MQVKSIAECSKEHSAILLTCIKLPFALKTLLKTGLTVLAILGALWLMIDPCYLCFFVISLKLRRYTVWSHLNMQVSVVK